MSDYGNATTPQPFRRGVAVTPNDNTAISPTPQPFRRGVAVTPNDNTAISPTPNAIIVGAGGNVAFVGQDGQAFTINGLAAGTIYPIAPSLIKATGTTATGIVALYY